MSTLDLSDDLMIELPFRATYRVCPSARRLTVIVNLAPRSFLVAHDDVAERIVAQLKAQRAGMEKEDAHATV